RGGRSGDAAPARRREAPAGQKGSPHTSATPTHTRAWSVPARPVGGYRQATRESRRRCHVSFDAPPRNVPGSITHRRARRGATKANRISEIVNHLTFPTLETARVITAVAKGDLSQEMALELEGRPLTGEFLRTANVVNRMVDTLGSFADEVTRVAREVGGEGR